MTLPNPIPIIIPALEDTQQTFQISLGELEAILRDPRIADKKVSNTMDVLVPANVPIPFF
jgi:atlastin